MTIGGWIILIISVSTVVTLFTWYIYKVLNIPGETEHLCSFEQDKEDQKNEHVFLWSLIPLTRPMDTLVITLKNSESEFIAYQDADDISYYILDEEVKQIICKKRPYGEWLAQH